MYMPKVLIELIHKYRVEMENLEKYQIRMDKVEKRAAKLYERIQSLERLEATLRAGRELIFSVDYLNDVLLSLHGE